MEEEHRKTDQRRQEVEAYNRSAQDSEAMRQLAEIDVDEAAPLLE